MTCRIDRLTGETFNMVSGQRRKRNACGAKGISVFYCSSYIRKMDVTGTKAARGLHIMWKRGGFGKRTLLESEH